MNDYDTPNWQHRVRKFPQRRPYRPIFSSSQVTVGAIHMAGMVAGILAADKMKVPSARWSAIAGFGIATGVGEAIWRARLERKQEKERER